MELREKVYEICVKYLNIREQLRDYTRKLMKEAHEKGTPVMRTMFYEFLEDENCWVIEDQYMFGDRYLVAPVLYPKMQTRKVYLPGGYKWRDMEKGTVHIGGQTIEVELSLDYMPVFEKYQDNLRVNIEVNII